MNLVREQKNQGINAQLVIDGNPTYQTLSLYKQVLDELGTRIINTGDLPTLLGIAKDFSPALIHAHSSHTFPLAYNLAKQLHKPLVITCHEPGLNRQEYNHLLEESAAIFCISQKVANKLRGFSSKITLTPNGVDIKEFQPKEKSDPIKIILFSRVDSAKQKAYDHFCKAADLLEDVEFYVASNKKPNSKTAKYLGWPHETAALLANTDILAGTGRIAIEGLATGNAVLILGRTFQGLLIPEKTAKQKITDVSGLTGADPCFKNIFYDLAKLTQNQIYLRQLQKSSRELAEKEFCNTKLTRRVIEVYEEVLRN